MPDTLPAIDFTNPGNLPIVNGLPDFSQFDLFGFLGNALNGIGSALNLPTTPIGFPAHNPVQESTTFQGLDGPELRNSLVNTAGGINIPGINPEDLQRMIGQADSALFPAFQDLFSANTSSNNAIETLQGLTAPGSTFQNLINQLNENFINNDAISPEALALANSSTEARGGNELIAALDAIESGGDPRKAAGVRAGQETATRLNISEKVGSEISGRNLAAGEFNAQKREEALGQVGTLNQLETGISSMIADIQKGQGSLFLTIADYANGLIDANIANERIQEIAKDTDINTFMQQFTGFLDTLGNLTARRGSAASGGGGGDSGGFNLGATFDLGDAAAIAGL